MVSLLRFPLAAFFSVLLPVAALAAPRPAAAVPYHAYWLVDPADSTPAEYLKLLVTRGSLAGLAGHEPGRALPLDSAAMTFTTYRKDSLWSDPFLPVKRVGMVDPEAKTVVLDGTTYRYEPCPLLEVIRLLAQPLGTLPVHRREHPLRGFEQTTRAFTLLLVEQLPPATARVLKGTLPLDDRLWALEKPYDPDDLLGAATRNQLARGKVPDPAEAEAVATGYRIRHGGLGATERGTVVGLVRVAGRVPGFAEAGELVWIVRFIDLGGGPESISAGVTQELWISAGSATVRPILP